MSRVPPPMSKTRTRSGAGPVALAGRQPGDPGGDRFVNEARERQRQAGAPGQLHQPAALTAVPHSGAAEPERVAPRHVLTPHAAATGGLPQHLDNQVIGTNIPDPRRRVDPDKVPSFGDRPLDGPDDLVLGNLESRFSGDDCAVIVVANEGRHPGRGVADRNDAVY